ncbi:MAG: SDR family NAD(P)-dependent oxidoreductase, partial [Novosphingobium sp.]|nr:SDR family NAD(P)-dependent oxidoreductase [Novosphingobium sp.]
MKAKVALVTGAAAGIGAACAKRLAQDGVAVGVLDLDEDRCADTVAAIQLSGGRALALGANVSSGSEVQAATEALRAAFGPINILVNNAGVTDFTPFSKVTEDLWERIFAVNVKGPFLLAQAVLEDMKAAGWGRIVNISSSSAQTGAANMVAYSSSKGALVAMTRSMAQEFGPFGITVNNIPPGSVMGTIMSEANRSRFQIPEDVLLSTIPVRRFGEPSDIANAC